jgi:coiled-coil domain-containing protein 55
MKLSFSLGAKKAQPIGEKPTVKAPSAFSAADDDTLDAAPTAADKSSASANKKLLAQNVTVSQSMKKRMDAEKKVDATVFEYDEVWDKMQEAKAKQKLSKEAESKERKVMFSAIVDRMQFLIDLLSLNTLAVYWRPRKHVNWITCGQRRR